MRRYTITINGTQHVIDVAESSSDLFTVMIDGTEVEVRLTDHQDLAQAEITPGIATGSRAVVRPQGVDSVAGGQVPSASTVTPAPRPTTPSAPAPAAPSAGASTGGANAQTAPMPGVVLSIDATVGQQVTRGDLLMVLEAMKMKNEIRANRDGQITEIPVTEGAQVKFGDALVRFA